MLKNFSVVKKFQADFSSETLRAQRKIALDDALTRTRWTLNCPTTALL